MRTSNSHIHSCNSIESDFVLVQRKQRARVWATRVMIGQIVLLIFSFILIGIAGNYVSANSAITSNTYSAYSSSYSSTSSNLSQKYQVMQAQLAFAILLMFSGWFYVIFYLVVTYLALWRPFHTLDIPHLFTT